MKLVSWVAGADSQIEFPTRRTVLRPDVGKIEEVRGQKQPRTLLGPPRRFGGRPPIPAGLSTQDLRSLNPANTLELTATGFVFKLDADDDRIPTRAIKFGFSRVIGEKG